MKRTGPRFQALVRRGSASRVPGAVLKLLALVALPACCCVVGFVLPMRAMQVLKPRMERFCAGVVIGRPVAEVEASARRLGLFSHTFEFQYRPNPEHVQTTIVEARRSGVVWYCSVDHLDGVARSKRTYGHVPWD